MKKTKSNLDELQELKLLKIEHNGCWLAFWGLLAVILTQIAIGNDSRQDLAGEWIVFMCLALYLTVGCIRNGIWDRKLKPNFKNNIMASSIAAVVMGILWFIISYRNYHKLAGSIATGVIMFFSIEILCFLALTLTSKIYKKRLKKLLVMVLILFLMLGFDGIWLVHQKNESEKQQRKAEAIAALESVPTVTPTPAATPTPTPTPIPTVTPTPELERAYVFNPEDYLGTWYSTNGRVTITISKLTEKSVTFTYQQTNKKGTATCEAKVKKSVAGNAARVSFTDSLGNKATGYLTFDNGQLYVKIKTKTKAEGAGVHPSVDCIMVRG